jgi:GntR family transcriptional regulator
MQVELDFRSGVPIYVQIMDQIKHLVAAGSLRPGDQLPTVRQLATDLRINFNTVARAYRMLDEQGLISTQQGRGTYILEPESQRSAEQLRRQDLEWLTRHFLNEAARLSYTPADVQTVFKHFLQQWVSEGSPPSEHNEY